MHRSTMTPLVARSFPKHHPDAMAPAAPPATATATTPTVPTPPATTLAAPVAPTVIVNLPAPFVATQRQKGEAERAAACDVYAGLMNLPGEAVRVALYTAIANLERGEAVETFKRKLGGYTLPDSIVNLAREAGALNLSLTFALGQPDAAGVAPVTLSASGGNVTPARQPAQGGNASPGANRIAGQVSSSSRISAFDAAERGRKAGDNINIVKHDDGSATDTVSGETIPPRGLTAWLTAREGTVAAHAVGILRKYGQVD